MNVTFIDGGTQLLVIVNVDDEGFVNRVGEELFWATFEDVSQVQP